MHLCKIAGRWWLRGMPWHFSRIDRTSRELTTIMHCCSLTTRTQLEVWSFWGHNRAESMGNTSLAAYCFMGNLSEIFYQVFLYNYLRTHTKIIYHWTVPFSLLLIFVLEHHSPDWMKFHTIHYILDSVSLIGHRLSIAFYSNYQSSTLLALCARLITIVSSTFLCYHY